MILKPTGLNVNIYSSKVEGKKSHHFASARQLYVARGIEPSF